MKIVFAGTPDFAAIQLQALIEANFKIDLVLTQPDRSKGRGQKVTPSPVKIYALSQSIPIAQPLTLKDEAIQEQLKAIAPDLIIVSAYGMMVPQILLDLPTFGCWNVHASLLPRWRGAAPIHYAIWKGDTTTGISLMQLEAGLDSGPVLLTQAIPIEDSDTTGSLLQKLSTLGAKVLLDGLSQHKLLKAVAQDTEQVTFSPKIDKDQAKIDWTQSAQDIERMMRAFDPNPGCYAIYQGFRIKLFGASWHDQSPTMLPPGTIQNITKDMVEVSTQNGLLQLKVIQLPGKKRQTIEDILHAKPEFFKVGDSFQ